MSQTNQGLTPCILSSSQIKLPDGTTRIQYHLQPYHGPLPRSVPILTQLPQFRHLAQPPIVPNTQSTPKKKSEKKQTDECKGAIENPVVNEKKEKEKSTAPWGRKKRSAPNVSPENVVARSKKQKSLEPENTEKKQTFATIASNFRTTNPTNTSDSGTEDTNSDCSSDTRSSSRGEYKKALVYKTLKKLRVRADTTINGPEVGILEAGTTVKLVCLDEKGRKGRIVEPLDGWVSMKKKGKKMLIQIWNGIPTVCIRGLTTKVFGSEEELAGALRSRNINMSNVIWRSPSNRTSAAFIEFETHNDALQLKKKGLELDFGVPLKIDWSHRYRNEVPL